MLLKFFVFSCVFVLCVFKLNSVLNVRVMRRKARMAGTLDEQLEQEERDKDKKLFRKVFGKIGGGHEDGIDGGIYQTHVGGSWILKDLNGKDFSNQDLLGKYYLLFFGSTLCPDVCPLTLAKMMKTMRMLKNTSEGKQYIRPVPVFVSVNPTYDTPDRLR